MLFLVCWRTCGSVSSGTSSSFSTMSFSWVFCRALLLVCLVFRFDSVRSSLSGWRPPCSFIEGLFSAASVSSSKHGEGTSDVFFACLVFLFDLMSSLLFSTASSSDKDDFAGFEAFLGSSSTTSSKFLVLLVFLFDRVVAPPCLTFVPDSSSLLLICLVVCLVFLLGIVAVVSVLLFSWISFCCNGCCVFLVACLVVLVTAAVSVSTRSCSPSSSVSFTLAICLVFLDIVTAAEFLDKFSFSSAWLVSCFFLLEFVFPPMWSSLCASLLGFLLCSLSGCAFFAICCFLFFLAVRLPFDLSFCKKRTKQGKECLINP